MNRYIEYDFVYEFLILTYKFNKDLQTKIKTRSKQKEIYYLLNADFLNHLKKLFSYDLICKELKKDIYKYDLELDSIRNLIQSIKIKVIIDF